MMIVVRARSGSDMIHPQVCGSDSKCSRISDGKFHCMENDMKVLSVFRMPKRGFSREIFKVTPRMTFHRENVFWKMEHESPIRR